MAKEKCAHGADQVCYECFGEPVDHDPRPVLRCAACSTPIYEGLRCDRCEAQVLAARGEA